MDVELQNVIAHFPQVKEIREIESIQSGLINRTYRIVTEGADDYILQCINHLVFTNVELLQHNIECVTEHIRAKLLERGEQDVERRVLRFLPTLEGKTYHFDGAHYWRVCVYIRNSYTQTEVTPDSAYLVGLKFGEFESMLADLPEKLGETIPDFHNMEFRMTQLREAVSLDKAKRRAKVQALIDEIERDADEMCRAERLYREGKLPKRICHCDTKVSNMLFDAEGKVLCIIDSRRRAGCGEGAFQYGYLPCFRKRLSRIGYVFSYAARNRDVALRRASFPLHAGGAFSDRLPERGFVLPDSIC